VHGTVFAIENDFGFEFGLSVECVVKFFDFFAVRFGSVEELARTALRHDLSTQQYTNIQNKKLNRRREKARRPYDSWNLGAVKLASA